MDKMGAPGWDGVSDQELVLLLSHLDSQASIRVENREFLGGAALLQVLGTTVGLKSCLITLHPGDRSGHCRYSVCRYGPGSDGVPDVAKGSVKVPLSDCIILYCSGSHFWKMILHDDLYCIRIDAWVGGSTHMHKMFGDFGALITGSCALRVRNWLSDPDNVISLARPPGYEPSETWKSALMTGECLYISREIGCAYRNYKMYATTGFYLSFNSSFHFIFLFFQVESRGRW